MKKQILFFVSFVFLISSCIQDEALNPEADILAITFPVNSLRTEKVEINNEFIVVYPKKDIDLRDEIDDIEISVSQGATFQKIPNSSTNDTIFFIDVTSESKQYMKRYAVIESYFQATFDFENWVKFSTTYGYENPKEGNLQWYSSNNGAAIAWNNSNKPADEYLIRKTSTAVSGNWAAELRTMAGPGKILGGLQNIPCLSGSLYLGGFNALTGLSNPLRSTYFGVPFNDGKPTKLTGYYRYKEGTDDYIVPNPDVPAGYTTDPLRHDTCDIYAVLFKTDANVQYLYGDNVGSSPNIVAKAKIRPEDIRTGDHFQYFEINFDYTYLPFSWAELANDEYKITIVFASSHRGQYYEGRPGNTLIVDQVELHYDTN
ncbi:hypothetical protein FACS1894162_0090 [Bacteroidia bacterium]|nr:hypothetical protein FACS1894162_0090 [Bacteroidia bacterium]